MNSALHDAVEHLISGYLHGSQLVLLFDYDGALAEFRTRPVEAELPPSTRHDLETLASLPRVTVGVISGRELAELERVVGLADLYYAGTDGLELEFHHETITHPLVQHSRQLLAQVAIALNPVIQRFPGAWLERKRFGLAVHYRQLDPQAESEIERRTKRVLHGWAERLHVVTGAKVIEITPDLGWTKGTAIEFVLDQLPPEPCLLLFAGDDSSDVEAMWEVGIHDGITIGVGHALPTTAQFELQDCHAVGSLLNDLCHGLGCGGDSAAALTSDE